MPAPGVDRIDPLRQFLALELPVAWREVLAERRRLLSARASGWRWANIDSIHLTLRFLGAVEAGIDDVARRAWPKVVRGYGPFELELGSLGCFPERGRPRILWAGVESDPALTALAASLERVARGLGFEPESREFHPHLTLARARRGERATLPEGLAAPLASSFVVSEVILFQSVLHSGGPRYTALERYRLDVAASGD